MKQFYTKYAIQHVTTAPYHPASNGIAERFVRSFKEGMAREQAAGVVNKNIALRNILRTFRWTPHTTTGTPPADMLLQRSVRTSLSRLKPTPPRATPVETQYHVGQLIWAMNHQPNKRPQWIPATVQEHKGSMVYIVQLPDGQLLKRHRNQLRPRVSNDDRSVDLDSLPDNLAAQQRKQSPRYPKRIRKPPQRYSTL